MAGFFWGTSAGFHAAHGSDLLRVQRGPRHVPPPGRGGACDFPWDWLTEQLRAASPTTWRPRLPQPRRRVSENWGTLGVSSVDRWGREGDSCEVVS